MEERQIIIARPWDCDGLDPFRDGPVANPRENLLTHQSTESERRKQTETFVFVVTVLRCQLKKSKCVVGLSRDGRNVSNQVL